MRSGKLNHSTIENLKYYVYLLKDPINSEIFYVGKGKGNRINSHQIEALVSGDLKSEKINRIKTIINKGFEVELLVLRHGLSEKEALEVEAATIDLLQESITNIMSGHHSDDRGLMSIKDIELKYQAEKAKFNHNVLLIRVNQKFRNSMSQTELYEITRSAWRISEKKVNNIEIVCAVYKGIVREVFIPDYWNRNSKRDNRMEFTGRVANNKLRDMYIDKSVEHVFKKGEQTPFRYVMANEID